MFKISKKHIPNYVPIILCKYQLWSSRRLIWLPHCSTLSLCQTLHLMTKQSRRWAVWTLMDYTYRPEKPVWSVGLPWSLFTYSVFAPLDTCDKSWIQLLAIVSCKVVPALAEEHDSWNIAHYCKRTCSDNEKQGFVLFSCISIPYGRFYYLSSTDDSLAC